MRSMALFSRLLEGLRMEATDTARPPPKGTTGYRGWIKGQEATFGLC
jgi:hypothetical protein